MHFNTPEPLFLSKETIEEFVLVDVEKLGKVISPLKPTTCPLDLIPSPHYPIPITYTYTYTLRNNLDLRIRTSVQQSKILEKLVFNQLKDFIN